MDSEEKALLLFKLARKCCWGGRYKPIKTFKRFSDLEEMVKDLVNKRWILVHKGGKCISLNTKFKKEIVSFVERQLPHLKGRLK